VRIGAPFPGWLVCLAACLILNVALGPLVVVTLFRSQIAMSLGVSEILVASLYGGYFFLASLGGRYIAESDVSSSSLLFVIGAIGVIAGCFLCRFANSFSLFGVCFLFSISLVGGAPFLSPLAHRVIISTPGSPALGLAIASLGLLTAFGLWRSIFNILAIENWRDSLWVAGWIAAFVLPALSFIVQQRRASTLADTWTGVRAHVPWRYINWAAVGYGFLAVSGTLIIINFPELDRNDNVGISSIVIFSLAAAIGRLGMATGFDAGWQKPSLLTALALTLVSTALLAVASHAVNIAVGLFLFGLGYGGLLPIAMVFVGNVYPYRRPSASSRLFYWGGVGVAVGSLGVGWGEVHPDMPMVLSMLTCGVGSLLWLAFVWYSKRSRSR
jgi:hypothetical protein